MNDNSRIRFVFFLFTVLFVVISIKLFLIQIVQGSYSLDYLSTQKIEPERGKILDRNGEPLAVNQTRYLMFVEPKKVKDKDSLIEYIDEIFQIGEATLEARIDSSKDWVAIQGNIPKDKKLEFEKQNYQGVGFEEEIRRLYPEASLAAHLVGFVGRNDKGDSLGYFGLEGYYDKDLSGLPGVLKSERDVFNRPILVGTQERVDAEDGRTFILTIDKTVQHIIKENLKAGVERYKARSGCVIAVEPNTMEILGLSCLPDFDPSTYYDFQDSDFKNWAISSVYEPGSTFKPLIMAAALDEGVVKPTDTFNESCSVEMSGYTIKNWDEKCEGRIDMTRILEKSSNIGMVYLGEQLGKDKLHEYITNYGFGEYTNIDLQGEVSGQVKPLDTWYPIDQATSTFGQGISVTALQLVRAFSAVVNGGNLMRPYVVKAVLEDGTIREREPQIQKKVLDEKTSRIVNKMLVSTIEHSEAPWDIPEGFTFGGKTGTAQIALEGSYDSSKTIASFVGFAPAEDPKFLMLVVVQEPGVSGWGSETAAPIFFDIARELLIYYNVSPN